MSVRLRANILHTAQRLHFKSPMTWIPQLVFGILAVVYARLAARQKITNGDLGISGRTHLKLAFIFGLVAVVLTVLAIW